MNKLLQGLIAGAIQKKLVETLANNRQFQRMSLQFRDKVEELTGNSPKKHGHGHHSNNKHHYNHTGASSKMFESTNKNNNNNNNTVKYTNDIYENQRIYQQQQRLKNQQQQLDSNDNGSGNGGQEEKSFFSHLINGFKEEFNSEVNRVKTGGKIQDLPDVNKDKKKY